jgi:hypothetical protein
MIVAPTVANPEGDSPRVETKPSIPEGDRSTQTSNKGDGVATRSGRISKPPARLDDYVAIESVFSVELDCQELDDHPVVYAVSTDPDVLQYHVAMKQPDRVQFIHAMVKVIQAHTDGKNWIVVQRSAVPNGHQVLPAVWELVGKPAQNQAV